MKGKDLMEGLSFIGSDLVETAEYGDFSVQMTVKKSKQTRRSVRKAMHIAAVIALAVLLVGCAAVYVLSIQNIHIGQQQREEPVFAYDSDTGEAVAYLGQETVTEQVLTLGGLKGSANYRAAQEWFEFKQEYDPDFSIANKVYSSESAPEFPAEYSSYNLYTQEMKDKLDEILAEYDLKLIGRSIPFRTEELTCKALGLENIAIPESNAIMELDYAAYQECGNLNMDFNLLIPGSDTDETLETRCHIFYMRKDAFTEDVISLKEISTWKEWNYTTESGNDVLIFRSPSNWAGYIFCDMPNYTVTLRFEFIQEVYSNDAEGNTVVEKTEMEDRQIQRLADAIDFAIEPALIDGWESFTGEAAGSGEEIDGYTIELKSVTSDGINAYITLGITAPEGVDLTQHNGYPIRLNHSNRWGVFEPVTDAGEAMEGAYAFRSEEDGDGRVNTQNAILKYSASPDQLREDVQPFGFGKVWNIYWQDIYASYYDEKNDHWEEQLLVEGTWSFDVVFENVITEELEFIQEPVPSRVSYGWDLQGNDIYEETMITSLTLRPMGATIICDLEDVAPDFLTEGDRCVYVVMRDESRITLYGDNAGGGIQNLQTDSETIDLSEVAYILLPDGTILTAP